jgi:hypothetical protein
VVGHNNQASTKTNMDIITIIIIILIGILAVAAFCLSIENERLSDQLEELEWTVSTSNITHMQCDSDLLIAQARLDGRIAKLEDAAKPPVTLSE